MKRGCSGPNARRLGDVAKPRHWGHRQARRGVDSAVRGGMVDVRWRTTVFVQCVKEMKRCGACSEV
jgi:hypothetical protein